MLNNIDINFFAFSLSGLLATILGALWYHPKILGEKWFESRGKKAKDMKFTPMPIMISFFLWILSACFYAFLAQFLQIATPAGYFCLACLLWVAFAMPPTLMNSLHSGYPFEAVAIDASYQLGGYYIFALVHIVFLEAGWL